MVSQLEEVFGDNGKKGYQGERDMLNEFLIPYYGRNFVRDNTGDPNAQSRGYDFSITKPEWKRWYTLDIKSNLKKPRGNWRFYLDIENSTKSGNLKPGWFQSSTADRIYHYNHDAKCSVYYDLKQMRQRIHDQEMMDEITEMNNKDQLIPIYTNDTRVQDLFKWVYK